MPLAPTALKQNREVNSNSLFINPTPSGNYSTGGDTLNLGAIANPKGLNVTGPTNSVTNLLVGVFSENLSGYYAQVVPGTTLANFKVKFFALGGAEVSAGAYPSQITSGSLVLSVLFDD
jgi:hypothetical protein